MDFLAHRICPGCGNIINLKHNFCKFCGIDLSGIKSISQSDRTLKELATTALTDPNAEVRTDAVDTLGDFGEYEALGVLTHILLNDPHPSVRKQAAHELGVLHHPVSLDVLAKALRDKAPSVRKEAIEGLKKIKLENKPKEVLPQEKVSEEIKVIEPVEMIKETPQDEVYEEPVYKEPEFEEVEYEEPENEEPEPEPEVEESKDDSQSEEEKKPLEEIEPEHDDYYQF